MPFYQFIVPSGGPTLKHKKRIADAFTRVHTEVTGAPAVYVQCAFIEVPSGSIFVAGEAVDDARMVGIIRPGRSTEVKRTLLTRLAEAWSEVTGEPVKRYALWLQEVPGAQTMEDGIILPEPSEDHLRPGVE